MAFGGSFEVGVIYMWAAGQAYCSMVCLDGILPMRCLANSIYLDMLSLVDDYGVRHLWRIKYGMECV